MIYKGRLWYGFDVSKDIVDDVKAYLVEKDIRFEPSECYSLVHFECYMTVQQYDTAIEWIENLITERFKKGTEVSTDGGLDIEKRG